MRSTNDIKGRHLVEVVRAAHCLCLQQISLIFESMDSVLSQMELLHTLLCMGEPALVSMAELIEKWDHLHAELIIYLEFVQLMKNKEKMGCLLLS